MGYNFGYIHPKKCSLCAITKEMSKYHIIPGAHHIGNLDQHSIWTMKQIQYCLKNAKKEKHCSWCSQINPRNQDLLLLAGFFHDVGKMGPSKYLQSHKNGTFSYSRIPHHEIRSWRYLAGLETLLWDHQEVNLYDYIQKQCGLTPVQMSVVAILARLHYHLGHYGPHHQYPEMCKDIIKRLNNRNLPQEWKTFWKSCNQQEVADEIFRMFLCLGTMDIVGARPPENKKNGYSLMNSYGYSTIINQKDILNAWLSCPERKKLKKV